MVFVNNPDPEAFCAMAARTLPPDQMAKVCEDALVAYGRWVTDWSPPVEKARPPSTRKYEQHGTNAWFRAMYKDHAQLRRHRGKR